MREQTYSSVHDVTEGLASPPSRFIPLETAPVTCCSLVQMAQAATPWARHRRSLRSIPVQSIGIRGRQGATGTDSSSGLRCLPPVA